MPDIAASPDHCADTVCATSSSQTTPACTVTSSPTRSTPDERISTTTPGQPASATTRLRAAADDQDGLARLVGRAHCVDDLVGARRCHRPRGGAAEAQSGQLGQRKLLGGHGARRYPGPLWPSGTRPVAHARSVSRPVARPTRIGCAGWTTGSRRRSARTCGRRSIRSWSTSATAPHRSPPSSSPIGCRKCVPTFASSASRSIPTGSPRRNRPRTHRGSTFRTRRVRTGRASPGPRPGGQRVAAVRRTRRARCMGHDAGQPRRRRPDRRGNV